MLDLMYKEIFEQSKDGFIIAKDNVILECNDALVRILGYDSQEELHNLHASEISPEFQPDGSSSHEKSMENLQKSIENKSYRFEWLHLKKNKDEAYCEVTLSPVTYKDQAATFATVRDISDRKVLETANKKLTTRLELAFHGNNDGIWDLNLEEDTVYFSPSWKNMLGYTEDEVQSSFEVWESLVHPDDLEHAMKDIQDYLSKKTDVYENYHRLKHKDGSWVWILDRGKAEFDENGKATRFIGTHTNITKEKNLEQELQNINNTLETIVHKKTSELRKANTYLETIFNTVKDGIAILDLESNFILVNDAYETMTGYTKKELYKTSCINLTVPSMIDESQRVLSEVLKKGLYMDYEKWCILSNSKQLPVNMDIVLMPDKKQLLLVVRDLSEERKQQKEKQLQEQQILHQSRLAQMGEMISMIAHQWRQPLGAISTTAANLSLKIEIDAYDLETEESREACGAYFLQRLQNIESYVESLTNTIDDFRNFYKPNKARNSVQLDTVVKKSLDIIESSLVSAGIEILHSSNDSQFIEMYDNEMMQVILNIMKNAQDNFAEKDVKYPKITININHKSISIEDNGGGIPQDILDRIFDPYFSTKNEKNGTGLGLYMSKMIIEDHHNGTLSVRNLKEGACFTIALT